MLLWLCYIQENNPRICSLLPELFGLKAHPHPVPFLLKLTFTKGLIKTLAASVQSDPISGPPGGCDCWQEAGACFFLLHWSPEIQ